MRECACGFVCKLPPTSSAWHRAHEAVHMIVFPQAGEETRKSLALITKVFERQEARAAEALA